MHAKSSAKRTPPPGREGKVLAEGVVSPVAVERRALDATAGGTAAPQTRQKQKAGAMKKLPKAPKVPVPKGAVWWPRGLGHPALQHFGAELRHQRQDLRGWSLEDLHQACGLCKSFLCDLENGVCTVTQEVIFELEAALGMVDGGLMRLVRRRWLVAVAKDAATKGLVEPLARQVRALRRAWRRQALREWLVGWLPGTWTFAQWEPALES